jgi:hypothetical protein
MFFVQRGSQMVSLVNAVIDSVASIAGGNLGAAAGAVERALATGIPVAIGFLSSLLGLGNVSEKVQEIIQSARGLVDKGINAILNSKPVQMVVGFIKKVISRMKATIVQAVSATPGKPDTRTEAQKQADLDNGIAKAEQLLSEKDQPIENIEKRLPAIQQEHGLTQLVLVVDSQESETEVLHVHGEVNPRKDGKKIQRNKELSAADIETIWERTLSAIPTHSTAQTHLDETSVRHAQSQITKIFSVNNVPASDADKALDTIDKLLERALQETNGDEISKRLSSVSGVANKLLKAAGSKSKINAHHIQRVAAHPGTYPETRRGRLSIPKRYSDAIQQWATTHPKRSKAEQQELIEILRNQLMEEKHPSLESPLEEIEMIITTAEAHSALHRVEP